MPQVRGLFEATGGGAALVAGQRAGMITAMSRSFAMERRRNASATISCAGGGPSLRSCRARASRSSFSHTFAFASALRQFSASVGKAFIPQQAIGASC